jgi:hypothetical protein
MAALVLKMSVSLDGYAAPIDGSTDWVAAGGSDDGAGGLPTAGCGSPDRWSRPA